MSAANIAASLSVNGKGVPYPNHANCVFVLQHDPTFAMDRIWYDEFQDQVFLANSPTREWRDDDDTRITVDLQDRFGIRQLGRATVGDCVRFIARQRTRHVVRDWLNTLTWDGTERIATAFEDYWGADGSDYTRAASANFFIGLAARVYQPGCKLDTMPVFEGKQGIRKSSALEVLGGQWYGVAHESVSAKDFLQGLRGKLVIEIAELQSFSRSEVNAVKTMMSTRTDHYRPPYGRTVVAYPRSCVFAGTTNADDWGSDETGLRRFWPIACGTIQLALLAAVREQLFAEAVHQFKASATWWEMPATTEAIQATRQHHDEWTDTVLGWVDLQLTDAVHIMDVATSALKLDPGRVDRGVQGRIGRILRLGGMEHKKRREGARTRWVWVKPEESDGTFTV